jgi:hypothetical protein
MSLNKRRFPLWKRIVVRVFGEVFAYEKDSLCYYIGYCPKHGYFIDHERGYYEKFTCSKCLEERTRKPEKGLV